MAALPSCAKLLLLLALPGVCLKLHASLLSRPLGVTKLLNHPQMSTRPEALLAVYALSEFIRNCCNR